MVRKNQVLVVYGSKWIRVALVTTRVGFQSGFILGRNLDGLVCAWSGAERAGRSHSSRCALCRVTHGAVTRHKYSLVHALVCILMITLYSRTSNNLAIAIQCDHLCLKMYSAIQLLLNNHIELYLQKNYPQEK